MWVRRVAIARTRTGRRTASRQPLGQVAGPGSSHGDSCKPLLQPSLLEQDVITVRSSQSWEVSANIMDTFLEITTEVRTSSVSGGLGAVTKKAAKRGIKIWMVRDGKLSEASEC